MMASLSRPIAAASFLGVLGRVNRELGTTVLLTEHRLEDALPLATRAAVLDRGELLCADTPARVGEALPAKLDRQTDAAQLVDFSDETFCVHFFSPSSF